MRAVCNILLVGSLVMAGAKNLLAQDKEKNYISWFETLTIDDVPLVGGKNASLGEMIGQLTAQGIRVPGGFAITAQAYRDFIVHNKLEQTIQNLFKDLDKDNLAQLQHVGACVRELIAAGSVFDELQKQVIRAYHELESRYGKRVSVALRSSATAEDLPDASFAGQQETLLNITGAEQVVARLPELFASLFTDRAIIYRIEHGFDHMSVALSIGVQKMVRSDRACSGVMFTLDTESGFPDVVYINGAWGLGEYVVQGTVDPDEWYVHQPTLKKGYRSLLKQRIGKKTRKLVFAENVEQSLKDVTTTDEELHAFCLSSQEVLELARYATTIEEHYSKRAKMWRPMDIEWAKDGIDGQLYIVQARPETVHAQKKQVPLITEFTVERDGARSLAVGNCVGSAVATGQARVIVSVKDIDQFREGEILVTDMTDPDWVPIMKKASGIITDRGGRTCHAAIVSRELGIPAIVGTGTATEVIRDGMPITLDCSGGVRGVVYNGMLPTTKVETPVTDLLPAPCKVMVNIGNPDEAFKAAMLPNDGVGLARLEFIINSSIQIHPLALVHPEQVRNHQDREIIERLTHGYTDKRQFFVDKLAQEAGTIAAAFYPKPVIIRLSDFKSNEYRQLIAGDNFEPVEENPMIGFRGASRYYHPQYREAFALECAAMKKIREEMGLTNVKLMIPFVRTITEAKSVIDLLAEHGLRQKEHGLEVIMMCEIPSNVILIDEFSKLFDGFSIGSNDLTQFTLGVDRDSALVADKFDERDPAVQRMIQMAISGAQRNGKPIGICGQAPSDHPEFAAQLIAMGIDSISLIADSIVKTRLRIGHTTT